MGQILYKNRLVSIRLAQFRGTSKSLEGSRHLSWYGLRLTQLRAHVGGFMTKPGFLYHAKTMLFSSSSPY